MDPVFISPRIADKIYTFMGDCFASVADIVDPGSVLYRDRAAPDQPDLAYHGHGHFDGPGDYVSLNSYGSVPLEEPTNHCHVKRPADTVDYRARRKLIIASALCLVFMIAEAIGGALAHSLAVVTDAAHLLTDFASFMISLMAIYLASRPPTKRMTFGWLRAEVMGAMISVLMIWLITGILVYLAIQRMVDQDYEIHPEIMLITAAVGVGFNLVMGLALHQHSHAHFSHGHDHDHDHDHHEHRANNHQDQEIAIDDDDDDIDDAHQILLEPVHHDHGHSHNINVKAAFIHVLGDFCQSLGVLIASIVIYMKPEYKIADPICTFIFSIMVLITTINILKDTIVVLMEGAPPHISYKEVKDLLTDIAGVKQAHNLHVWALTTNRIVLTVHLAVTEVADHHYVLKHATRLIRRKYHIHDVTVQVERYADDMIGCRDCQEPGQ